MNAASAVDSGVTKRYAADNPLPKESKLSVRIGFQRDLAKDGIFSSARPKKHGTCLVLRPMNC